jgi:uncharacterized repeat protein (TIGR01451 family)
MKRSLWKLSVLVSVVALGLAAAALGQRGMRPAEPGIAAADPMSDAPLWGVEETSEPAVIATALPEPGLLDPSPAASELPVQRFSFETSGTEDQTGPAPVGHASDAEFHDPVPSAIDFRKFQSDSENEFPAPDAAATTDAESSPGIVLAQAGSPSELESGGFAPNVSGINELDAPSSGDSPPAFDAPPSDPVPFADDPDADAATNELADEPVSDPADTSAAEPDRFSFSADETLPPAESTPPVFEAPAGLNQYDQPNPDGIAPATQAGGVAGSTLQGSGAPDPRLFGTQTSMLTIEKTSPPSVNVGETTEYEIVVRNTGSAAAHGVVVRDQVPQGTRLLLTEPAARQQAEGLSWDLDTLNPGEERRFGVQLVALDEGEIGSVARVEFSAAASARTLVTRPQLTLALTAPAEVHVGDELTLLVQMSNPGSGTATGVMLHSPLPEAFEHPGGSELEYEAGNLAAGQTQDVPLTVTATRVGRVHTQMTATGDGGLQASAEAYVNVVAPQLTLTQTGPQRRYLGRPATYTLTVANPGSAAATGVTVVDYVPQTMEFIEASDGGQLNPAQGTVTWNLGELGAGQTRSVDVACMPGTPGEVRNFARATAARDLQAESELMTLVEGVPAILIEVVDIDDPIEIGAETTYEIRVINQGSKPATNVRITAQVPSQFSIVDATGPSDYHIEGDQIVFDPVPRLGPRADTAYRVHVSGQAVGDVRFRVHLATDQMTEPVIEEESTRIYSDR